MCTFENGLCNDWLDAKGVMRINRKIYPKVARAVKKDKLVNFKILTGPSPSLFTGPRVDHTTLSAKGKTLWMDAVSMKDGEIAVAQTPEINMMVEDLKETWCVSFWYLAYCCSRFSNISSTNSILQYVPGT